MTEYTKYYLIIMSIGSKYIIIYYYNYSFTAVQK